MYVQTLSDNKKGANLKESHYICFKSKKNFNIKIFIINKERNIILLLSE